MRLRRPFAAGSTLGLLRPQRVRDPGRGRACVRAGARSPRGDRALGLPDPGRARLPPCAADLAAERITALTPGSGSPASRVHFKAWPWSLHNGLPMLDEAEGLREEQLPAYNSVLWAWGISSALSLLTETAPGRGASPSPACSTSRSCSPPPSTTSAGRASRRAANPSAGARLCWRIEQPGPAGARGALASASTTSARRRNRARHDGPDLRLGDHPTATRVLPSLLGELSSRGLGATSSSRA